MNKLKKITIFTLLFGLIVLMTGCFNPLDPAGLAETQTNGDAAGGIQVDITVSLPDGIEGARGFIIDTLTITAARQDDPGITDSITIDVTPGADTASGTFTGLDLTTWIFTADARDSAGNMIYTGSRTHTVVDDADNLITMYLFQNVGNLNVSADWTGTGAVDTLRVTASKPTFDDIIVEEPALLGSEADSLLILNITAGTDWTLLVEGLNGGVSCFADTVTSVTVTAGNTESAAATLIQTTVTPVTFSVPDGDYLAAFDLTLETVTSGVTIYYTDDGTDPEAIVEDQYSGPFNVAGTTIKAFAVKGGLADAPVTTAEYSVDSPLSISAYNNHVGMVKSDNTLWMWGYNGVGQLGQGDTYTYYDVPLQVPGLWDKVSVGGHHTAAINTDGDIYCWGSNGSGRLGDGTTESRYTPTIIDFTMTSPWTDVAAGGAHTLAVNEAGELWVWGENLYGRLGLGDESDRHFPWRVGTDTDWAAVAAGATHSMAIKTNGDLYAWGENYYGQLGGGFDRYDNKWSPAKIGTSTWTSISANADSSMGIQTGGTIWSWGSGGYYRLGNGSTSIQYTPFQLLSGEPNTWTEIEAGLYHGGAVNAAGDLWVWGQGGYGALGLGDKNDRTTPQQNSSITAASSLAFGDSFSLTLDADGRLYGMGLNDYGQIPDDSDSTMHVKYPRQLGTEDTWTDISTGYEFNLALKDDGTLWAWGRNDNGALGDDTTTSRPEIAQVTFPGSWGQMAAGHFHSSALTPTGDLYSWGDNYEGQLGDGTTTDKHIATAPFDNQTGWNKISAGAYFTVGIRSGQIWAMGQNSYGQLGDGNTADRSRPTREVTEGTDWSDVAAGNNHVIAKKSDGTIWGWGYNGNGELGLGHRDTPVLTPTQIGSDIDWTEIHAGEYSSMAMKSDGSIWVWGNNGWGESGLGYMNSQYVLIPTMIREGYDWKSAYKGYTHTLALKNDNTLWTWGNGNEYRLGNGLTDEIYFPEMIGTDTDWDIIRGGGNHSLALKTDGTIWVWGANHYYACGQYEYSGNPLYVLPRLVLE